jgi:hypothetical protein
LLLRLVIGLRLFHETLAPAPALVVLGQSHDVAHLVFFAPTQQPPPAKTRVTTENDFDLRPRLPQA